MGRSARLDHIKLMARVPASASSDQSPHLLCSLSLGRDRRSRRFCADSFVVQIIPLSYRARNHHFVFTLSNSAPISLDVSERGLQRNCKTKLTLVFENFILCMSAVLRSVCEVFFKDNLETKIFFLGECLESHVVVSRTNVIIHDQ
jgi:hypothetical protein